MNELAYLPTLPIENGVVLQLADGTIQACNAAAQRLLGATLEQLRQWNAIAPPGQTIYPNGALFPDASHPTRVTAQTGHSCTNVVMGVYQPSGNLVWLLVNTESLLSVDPTPYGLITTITRCNAPDETAQLSSAAVEPQRGDRQLSNLNSTDGVWVWKALQTANEALEQQILEHIAELEQANRRLDESEERFRVLANSAPVLIWVNGLSGCEFVNRAYLDFVGVGEVEVQQYDWVQFVHPEDQTAYVNTYLAAIERRELFRAQCRLRRADGEYRWMLSVGQPRFTTNQDFLGYVGSTQDITDLKQSEADLQQSQITLQRQLVEIETIYQSAPIGLGVLDTDLRFVRINRLLAEINGFPIEAHLGRTVAELLPNLVEAAEQILRPILETGEPRMNVEITGETPAQPGVQRVWRENFLPLKDGDRIIGISIVCEEITDRNQAEQRLRESEERLRLGMQVAGFALANIDYSSNTVELSPEAAVLYGFPAHVSSVSREQLHAAVHPDDRPELTQLIEQALDPAASGWLAHDHRVVWQTGKERWLTVRKQVLFDRSQTVPKPTHAILVTLDITDRKAIETEREQLLQQEQVAREAAEQANRMKDEFLAILSHELRTPLNPILGWAKLLQSSQVTAERLQQGLTTIERNVKQQVQLIDDLLDISRIIRGNLVLNFAIVPLSEPILAALETVHLAAEAKSIGLKVLLDPTVDPVRGDAGRLQQLVWNLLTNAIKFTPSGGQVSVSLAWSIDHGSFAVAPMPNAQQPLKYAQIQVSDTGKGIQPEFLPYVFDLFRQQDSSVTRQFGGLGLGLAIARQVVEAHGGTIRAASAGEGQGATFTVQLPVTSIPNSSHPDFPTDQPFNCHNLRVLVVDDEVDSLELIQLILVHEGAIVEAVSLVPEALRLLTQSQFDLLISDIGMPDINGYEFIRQVRSLPPQSNRDVPAIALTAYAGEMNQYKAFAAGFQAHLAKPLDPERLLAMIAAVIKP